MKKMYVIIFVLLTFSLVTSYAQTETLVEEELERKNNELLAMITKHIEIDKEAIKKVTEFKEKYLKERKERIAANDKTKKANKELQKIKTKLDKALLEEKKSKAYIATLRDSFEIVKAQLRGKLAETENAVDEWMEIAAKHRQSIEQRDVKIQEYQDSIGKLNDKIWNLNIKISELEGKVEYLETAKEKAERTLAVFRLKEHLWIWGLKFYQTTSKDVAEIHINTNFDWVNTINRTLGYRQFVRAEIMPNFVIYEHEVEKNSTSIALDSEFEQDNIGLTSDILVSTTIKSSHVFKVKIKDKDKFKIFNKKKLIYRFSIKIYLAHKNDDGDIVMGDIFSEGYLYFDEKGRKGTFKPLQKYN